MRTLLFCLIFLMLSTSFAQDANLSGVVKVEGDIVEDTRVGILSIDRNGDFLGEVASVAPVGGTFSLDTAPVQSELIPFRSGSFLFPGLQNEYSVEPADANYLAARVVPYVDVNTNAIFDGPAVDRSYIGISSLEEPIGFFSLVYTDKTATVAGKGAVLEFSPGWNIFTVRYPEEGDPIYAVEPAVDDVILDVFLP